MVIRLSTYSQFAYSKFFFHGTGESVEENANLVIRLLIRRPECLGPALRGEGEGLLRAIIDANKMSERIADRRKVSDENNNLLFQFLSPLQRTTFGNHNYSARFLL